MSRSMSEGTVKAELSRRRQACGFSTFPPPHPTDTSELSWRCGMTYGDGAGGGGAGGRRINLRWIIALVIAVVGIIGYLGKKSVNPVTGETQYVNLNPNQEIALGLEA